LVKLLIFGSVTYLLALVIYNILRLGPGFAMIAIRNKDYVISIQELLSHPFDPLRPHLNDLFDWFPNLLTWPVFCLAAGGLLFGLKEKESRLPTLFLFLISFLPILAESLIARVFTPRYLLFAIWPIIFWAAYLLQKILVKLPSQAKTWLVLILLILPLIYDWRLLTDPQEAPLPRRMRSGYLEEWSSGYGITQVRDFIKGRIAQADRNILVGTEGYFGTLPDGLQIYFDQNPHVLVLGVGQPIREVPESLLNALLDNEVYLVVNQSRMLAGSDARLKLLEKYPKAVNPEGDQDFLLLYQLESD
jgi:4-amino-4-deoxy-L-arabinose transferase-like glycosyltransferase